ncbi:MAG TPA: di-heme oxidoredictase family protein [Vicinamibacterales bacterium]|jgi:CxxC motif-containing protein (DUF1111 family)
MWSSSLVGQTGPQEAPAGFDNLTNGFLRQPNFNSARATFEEREGLSDGLGPLYNADSCAACHSNPVTGAISQVVELRAGHFDGTSFVEQAGGSLINDRSIDASIQERVLGTSEVRTFRTSLNTLGDGFVEAIADSTLVGIANAQPSSMRGLVIRVPVNEAGGVLAVGRFGWKDQHASLTSFSADAYLNEMGITSALQPTENTSNGASVAAFDHVADPEDTDNDVGIFADFMRATKAPPRDAAIAATSDAVRGSQLFDSIGCGVCHTRTIVTAPVNTAMFGGARRVNAALGNKIIHPFSDFLMHNVGTGDGIVQNGGAATRLRLRTPPLWGMRSRDRLMHDGTTLTRNDAILRHAGEATSVINSYRGLSTNQKNQLVAFLNSL